jgi:hypothetical protein
VVIAVNLDKRRKEAEAFLKAHLHEMLPPEPSFSSVR